MRRRAGRRALGLRVAGRRRVLDNTSSTPGSCRGFADSKTLNEEKRERLYETIQRQGGMLGYEADVLSAAIISGVLCCLVDDRSAVPLDGRPVHVLLAFTNLLTKCTTMLSAGKMLSRERVSLNALAFESTCKVRRAMQRACCCFNEYKRRHSVHFVCTTCLSDVTYSCSSATPRS